MEKNGKFAFYLRSVFLLLLIGIILQPTTIYAGSGVYYGIDLTSNQLDAENQTELTTIPTPSPFDGITRDSRSETFSDISFSIGYFYQRRRTAKVFWAPEFFITTFDSDETIYGTNLKIGAEFQAFKPFFTLGVGRVDQFKQNKLIAGLGAQWQLTTRLSLNIEWLQWDTVKEDTLSTEPFGAQTLQTDTDTERDIQSLRLGIIFYLHE